jgi:hypothetical protein
VRNGERDTWKDEEKSTDQQGFCSVQVGLAVSVRGVGHKMKQMGWIR